MYPILPGSAKFLDSSSVKSTTFAVSADCHPELKSAAEKKEEEWMRGPAAPVLLLGLVCWFGFVFHGGFSSFNSK